MLERSKAVSWGLGLLALVVLSVHIPDKLSGLGVLFAALIGLLLNLSHSGTGSSVPLVAMMAYLTTGELSTALWSAAVGAVIGSAVLHRTNLKQAAAGTSLLVARLTLGLLAGAWVYVRLDGRLPLDRLDSPDILPLAGFAAVNLLLDIGTLLLAERVHWRRAPRMIAKHAQPLAETALLPLPFVVLGAVIYHQLSLLAFALLIAALLIMVIGSYLLNRSRSRYQQQAFELSSLADVSRAMRTSLDLNALLDTILEQVTRLLNASNFTVALYDPNRDMVYFPLNTRNHQPAPLEPRGMEQGLIEYVIRKKSGLLIVDDVPRQAKDMGLTPPTMPVYSWLGVPLLATDRVMGCMAVYSSRPDQHFTPNDLQLLTTIAGQAGIAIDNAQLYGQARDLAGQIITLNNIAAILSGTLDVQQILDLVSSSAVAISGCSAVALYLWWENTHEAPILIRENGLSEAFAAGPFRPILLDSDDPPHRQQPVIVSDARTDARAGQLAAYAENKRAWLELLLLKGDELLGVLVLFYDEPRRFSPHEIELLRNFANQAALAISNARLYTRTDEALSRRVEQLSALAEISRELTSTLTLQGLFQLVLDRALEATRSRTGMLLLRTEASDAPPSLVAYRGFAPDAFDQFSPLAGYVTQTYQTGQPTLIADLTLESDILLLDPDTRAQINVPIARGTEVLGVISLGSDRPDEYSDDDLAFVTQLANQARIAIDNARLFNRIEEARDRLQVILDSMREGVILIGSEGRITLANPRVVNLLGLDPQQIIGTPIMLLMANPELNLAGRLGFSSETLLNLIANLDEGWWDETTSDGGRITFEVAVPRHRFIDRTDAPVRDETGRAIGMLMVFTDVTEEHKLVQAREDLSSMIVHDLRGPLTAITTSLKLLNEISPPDDPLGKVVRQTADMASRATRKLLNLVNSLLDVSKLESGIIALEREPKHLMPLCTSVAEELGPLAQEMEVDLRIHIPDHLPMIHIDAEKIERVLLNLVDNAVKFTPADGYVIVRAYTPDKDSNFLQVEVEDSGPGIPDEYKERLFDRYAQIDGVRGRRRGTGLGLTFCRLAVEAHGGRIWVEDSIQGGATFAFTLPIAHLSLGKEEE